MDIATLVPGLVTFLSPFMPYLLTAGEKAAEEAGKKFGTEAWDRAKTLWARLRPKVEAVSTAQAAAQDVADDPDDEDAQAALRQQFKKLFAEEPTLMNELANLLAEARAASTTVIVSGDRSVGTGGSISGSTIITGDHNQTK